MDDAPLWNFELDLDEEDEAGNIYSQRGPSSRDCTILVVDAAEEMFSQKDKNGDRSLFCLTMDAIYTLMCRKCASVDADYVGVVVMNTELTSNEHNFQHISTMQTVSRLSAERVKEIDAFRDPEQAQDKFKERFDGHKDCNWDECLWLAGTLLNTCGVQFGTSKILIFSHCPQPHVGDLEKTRRLRQKIKDLQDQDIQVIVVPLGNEEDFNSNQFWKDALSMTEDLICSETYEDLWNDVRRKEFKKRSMGNIPFQLADGLEFSVGMYNLVSQAKVPTAVHLDRKRNETVKPVTTFFNKETGEKLLDRDMQKAQDFGGKRITMEMDEVESLRRLAPPGLLLLGFKEISCLKPEHHIRSSLFVFPDEKNVKGSTRLFRTLLDRCLAQKVMPICRMTVRKNMGPRLAALLPQKEERDDAGQQLRPPGFHAVFLPFADDTRNLSKLLKADRPIASEEQVEKAKRVLHRLQFPYNPDDFKNPAIDTHYRAVEAIALERKEMPEVPDLTKPNFERITKRAGPLLTEFKNSVFPEGYQPNKRKAGGAAKKPAADINLEEEAKADRLGKLTVAILKELSSAAGIRLTATKKADIIDQIKNHYSK